jgi:hypothetical protein
VVVSQYNKLKELVLWRRDAFKKRGIKLWRRQF